jgi:hypothetical protein
MKKFDLANMLKEAQAEPLPGQRERQHLTQQEIRRLVERRARRGKKESRA